MLVKLYHENIQEYEVHANSIRQILSLLSLQVDESILTDIMQNNHYFALSDSSGKLSTVVLNASSVFYEYGAYDTLQIIPEIHGNLPAAAGAAILSGIGVSGVTAASFSAIALTALINVGISFGINMLMSMLSPTAQYSKNVATTNVSNLFNNSPPIREQGGSVPLVFGNPYCTGYLISSGLTTEEA